MLTHIQEHNTSASISTAADAEARTTMARVREIVEEICFSSHKRTIATVSTVFTLLLSSVGALAYKVLEIDETPGAEQSVPEDIEPVPEASSKSDDTVPEDFVAPKNDTS